MRILPDDFRWYAAFHDEGDHPHIHMMAWSVKPGQAFLSKDGIRKIKSELYGFFFLLLGVLCLPYKLPVQISFHKSTSMYMRVHIDFFCAPIPHHRADTGPGIVSVKSSGVFRGRARHEIMAPRLTESVRDLEVCYGT